VVFPHNAFAHDSDAIRRFAKEAEDAGYEHINAYDHVLGADPNRPGWIGSFDYRDPFHEVFVLYGFLAACTSRLELVIDVLVLPQRQAALVAKQAAELDLLSDGRLRLGIGVGWNQVESEALGSNFHNRGRRVEEQVELIQALWSQDLVDFTGAHHRLDRVGLNPRPKREIPIWFGGTADVALRRAARLGEGWMSEMSLGRDLEEALVRLRGHLEHAGRDLTSFGIQGEVSLAPGRTAAALGEARSWADLGATHLAVTTVGAGAEPWIDHVRLLREFKTAWDGGRHAT
jgi:probable F420-dependent oxidoreductase